MTSHFKTTSKPKVPDFMDEFQIIDLTYFTREESESLYAILRELNISDDDISDESLTYIERKSTFVAKLAIIIADRCNIILDNRKRGVDLEKLKAMRNQSKKNDS